MTSSTNARSRCVFVLRPLVFAVVVQCCSGIANGEPVLSIRPMDPADGVMESRWVLTLELYVDGISEETPLSAYQARVQIVPLSGATGGFALTEPPRTYRNRAIFISDVANWRMPERDDWVFADMEATASVDAYTLEFAASLTNGAMAVTEPKYCGTLILRASDDAVGSFRIGFVATGPSDEDPSASVPLTFLRTPGSATCPAPCDINLDPEKGMLGTTIVVTGPTGCRSSDECDDGDACFDYCNSQDPDADENGCVMDNGGYGDVNGDGFADIDDTLITLACFGRNYTDCLNAEMGGCDIYPCRGDGLCDIDDTLATLPSFGFIYLCDCDRP